MYWKQNINDHAAIKLITAPYPKIYENANTDWRGARKESPNNFS